MIKKAVTVFAGSRDSYQVPIALAEANMLEAFITNSYFPKDQPWFSSTIGKVLPDHILNKRYQGQISSRQVHVSKRGFIATVASNLIPKLNMNVYKDRMLGLKARKYAINTDSALFSYSYYAYEAFKEGIDQPQYRFLFQVHPHPVTIRRILSEELELTPHARESLLTETELTMNSSLYYQLSQEPLLANGWIVASSFTKQTLVENNIPKEKIFVVPYGVDTSAFVSRNTPPIDNQPFTIIFVGQMIQRKGLSYLLDAIRLLDTKYVKLVLCGRGHIDQTLLEHYKDINVEVHLNLPLQQLIEKLHSSHIFVLPSLVEGFGLVIIEAMAAGLPIIITPHTGGADIIQDSREGFIVPIRSAVAIAEKLEWAIHHRAELFEMGIAASLKARVYTWSRFRHELINSYTQLFGHSDN